MHLPRVKACQLAARSNVCCGVMKAAALALTLLTAGSFSSVAVGKTVAPPGNSGVGQYVEVIPTAGGGRPSSTVHSGGAGTVHNGSGGGGTSSSSGGGSGSGSSGGAANSGGSGSISAGTQQALARQGPAGRAAASLAKATAPAGVKPTDVKNRPRPRGSGASGNGGSSPVSTIFKALTGSGSRGGLGPVLPIILIVAALSAAALALLRRRRGQGQAAPAGGQETGSTS